jgi:hypothetical protein
VRGLETEGGAEDEARVFTGNGTRVGTSDRTGNETGVGIENGPRDRTSEGATEGTREGTRDRIALPFRSPRASSTSSPVVARRRPSSPVVARRRPSRPASPVATRGGSFATCDRPINTCDDGATFAVVRRRPRRTPRRVGTLGRSPALSALSALSALAITRGTLGLSWNCSVFALAFLRPGLSSCVASPGFDRCFGSYTGDVQETCRIRRGRAARRSFAPLAPLAPRTGRSDLARPAFASRHQRSPRRRRRRDSIGQPGSQEDRRNLVDRRNPVDRNSTPPRGLPFRSSREFARRPKKATRRPRQFVARAPAKAYPRRLPGDLREKERIGVGETGGRQVTKGAWVNPVFRELGGEIRVLHLRRSNPGSSLGASKTSPKCDLQDSPPITLQPSEGDALRQDFFRGTRRDRAVAVAGAGAAHGSPRSVHESTRRAGVAEPSANRRGARE